MKILSIALLVVAVFIGNGESFHVQYFLSEYCQKVQDYTPGFRFHFHEVLLCKNVNFTEDFTEYDHFIKNEEVIVFEGGSVSVLNGDFFQQFPQTEHIIFKDVSLNLRDSRTYEDNHVLETLFFFSCKIFNNEKSKAFHELKGLKTFGIVDTELEFKIIDKELLEMNTELEDVTFLDSSEYPPKTITFVDIDCDVLVNAPNLISLYIGIINMKEFPVPLVCDKENLKELTIYGKLEKFPEELPNSLLQLDISFYEFDHLSRDNFRDLKNLTALAMYKSNLRDIDGDAFDDLVNLRYINFYDNDIEYLTKRHFENLKSLKTIRLKENIIKDLDLRDMGIEVDI